MLYDRDIREPLFMFLEERYGKIRILEEKNTGSARADVVMVLPKMVCAVEIKSDADTYARLSGQVKNYDLYFDMNYIVAGSSHMSHIAEHVPDYWGIISVCEEEKGVDFYVVREAALNPHRDMENKLSFLWRPELSHIQEINSLYKYATKSKAFVVKYIAQAVSHELLDLQISEELFERDYNLIFDKINEYRTAHGKHKRRKKKRRKSRSI